MAGGIDLWGCMIIVFVIVAGMVVVIKILLEFPGLLQWKCVYSEHERAEVTGPAYLRRDLELGRGARSPRASKHSLHKSNSRVMETEMVEMGSKASQVHWSRESEHNLQHHNESNRIEHHENSRHHDRSNQHERNGRPGLKSSKETVVIEGSTVNSTSKTRQQMNIDPSSPGIVRQC